MEFLRADSTSSEIAMPELKHRQLAALSTPECNRGWRRDELRRGHMTKLFPRNPDDDHHLRDPCPLGSVRNCAAGARTWTWLTQPERITRLERIPSTE